MCAHFHNFPTTIARTVNRDMTRWYKQAHVRKTGKFLVMDMDTREAVGRRGSEEKRGARNSYTENLRTHTEIRMMIGSFVVKI